MSLQRLFVNLIEKVIKQMEYSAEVAYAHERRAFNEPNDKIDPNEMTLKKKDDFYFSLRLALVVNIYFQALFFSCQNELHFKDSLSWRLLESPGVSWSKTKYKDILSARTALCYLALT